MAAPEIRLSVGLDLEFFRGQMRKAVNIAQSEFNANLKVTIDRQRISAELKNLERAIKRGTYRIEIGGNLEKAPDKVANLKRALSGLDGTKVEISISGVASINAKESRKIRTALRASIMGEGGKILVPASIVPAITNADVATFKKAVAEKLSGIKIEVGVQAGKFSSTSTGAAGLHEYMRSQGMSGGNMPGAASVGRSERLRKALEEQTVKQLNELAKGQGLSGYSKLKKDPLINKLIAELGNDAAEALLGNIKMQMGNAGKSPIKRSFLDQIARAVFFMAGVDPSQLRAQPRKLPEVNWPTTAVPRQRPPIGPSSTGRLLGAAAGPAGLISGNTGPFGFLPRTTAKGSLQDAMRMLPEKQAFAGGPGALTLSAEKLKSRVDAILREYFRTIAVQVSEAFDSPAQLKKQLNVFSYLAQSLKEAEQRTKENKVKEAVASLINALEGMAKDATFQARAARIRTARIFDLGNVQQRMLSPQRIAGMLPAGVGRESQRYATGATGGESRQAMTARRTAEAYARSALRGMDVMGGGAGRPASPYSYAYRGARSREAIVPYASPGAIVPTEARARGGTAAPAGGAGGRGAGAGGLNIPNLPGAGLVQELGTEFAFAAKQVLLFGTAYKALAFLTGFPQQVGDAVAALQTFRNTLKAISPSAGEAAASSQFILDIVDKYNVPLQSARDGFTKLYASMQPAGFSGNEIRDLFLGISQSAATFGMSADKVDRVNYAFAQMASKGQVMSEELKGQLGDVLPGAMAIFAEAAGFKGPEAITKFSKALEDGAYKGGAMKALLLNVGTIMRQEFGPGAEGAARTFQGSMNRMQNSLKLLYESFEPVAIGFLNSVVMPMTAGIKTITDGFNAFFSGQAAQTAQGSAFAKQLSELKPTFDGITANIKALIPSFQFFGSVLFNVAKVFTAIAGNPVTGFLAKVYVNVLLVNAAFSLLGGRVLVGLITSISASIGRFIALNFAMASLQRTTVVTNSALAGTQLQMQLLNRNAVAPLLTSLARLATFAAIAIAITVTINGWEELKELQSRIDKLKGEKNPVGPAGPIPIPTAARNYAGATREKVKADQQKQLEFVAKLRKDLKGLEKAFALGLMPEVAKKRMELLRLEIAKATEVLNLNPQQFKTAAEQQRVTSLAPIPPGEGKEGAAAAAAAKETARLEAYRSLQDQLSKAASAAEISRIQDEFEERFRLANSYYDLQEARANSFQKITINFQKELLAIEQRRQKAMLDAELDVRKARESVASEAMGTNGSSFEGAGTGFSGAQLQGATSAAAKFNGIANMCSESVKAFYKSLGVTLPGVTAWADTVRTAGETMTDWSKLKAGDIVATGRPGDTPHVGVYTGGENVFHQSRKRGLKAGNYPDLNYFKQGGYFVRPNASVGAGAGAGAPGKILGSERRQTLATQQTGFAVQDQRVANLVAEKKATDDTVIAIENYVAAIAPVAEQQLQNSILEKRVSLMKTGLSGDLLDTEVKIFEQQEKQRFALDLFSQEIEKNKAIIEKGGPGKETAIRLNAKYADSIDRLIAQNPKMIQGLKDGAISQRDANFEASQRNLLNEIDLAKALTPEAKMKLQIAQSGVTDPAQQNILLALEKQKQAAQKLEQDLQSIASTIGDSFGNAFKGIITGSMTAQQALAGFFQSIGDSFADMAAKMISEWLKLEAIKGIQSILSMLSPGAALGAADPGGKAIATGQGIFAAANGGIATGGFHAFAAGGIVKGPTLGLVGEGRYNEAVVPLPDGKSIPVDLSGMGGGAGAISTNIVINVNNGQAQSNTSGGASDLGRKMEGAVKQVLANELRPGGLLSGGRR
jgi:tape measure domain-containing protein